VVAGRQEGVEVPGVGVEVGEVLEVTVDEEDSEVIAVEEASEAMVAVVAVVVVAAEDSEEVAVVSEAHNTSDAQFFFLPNGFRAASQLCEQPQIAERNISPRRRCIRSYGLRVLTSSSVSFSLLIRSSCVLRVYNVAQGRVRGRTRHKNRTHLR
jgi:hypothetical protein